MKKASIALMGILCSTALCFPAYARTEGQWISGGTQFEKPDGSLAKNEWIEGENGSYFYIGENGRYVTGWHSIKEQNSDAVHDYYFNPLDGAMFYDTYTPDGYWVNKDGVWTGERKEEASSGTAEGTASKETETVQETQAAQESQASQESQETEAAAVDGYDTEKAAELISILNAKRQEAGKAALAVDESLMKAAQIRAGEVADSEDGQNLYVRPEKHYMAEASGTDRMMTDSSVTAVDADARQGFTSGRNILITESVAWKVESPDAAVADWFAKNDQGEDKSNKEFILDVSGYGFDSIGASCYVKDGMQYYSVFIGAKQD